MTSYSDKDPYYTHPSRMFRRHGKTWYLLPVFLSIIGGIIAYVILRNNDPKLAKKTLLLGIIVFVALVACVAALATFQDDFNKSDKSNTDITTKDDTIPESAHPTTATAVSSLTEIKEKSISVPYEMLIKYSDAYVGDVIRYKGHVIGVLDGQDDDGSESYVLKVEVYDTDDRPFAQDRLIWSEYTPRTDGERALVKSIASNSGLFTMADSKNAVNVWALMNGLRDFDIMFKTYEIPETEILALELIADGGAGGGVGGGSVGPTSAIYTVSYDSIPSYVNATAVTAAMNDAMSTWTTANPSIIFETVKSDANLVISWEKFMQPRILGTYTQYNVTTRGGGGGDGDDDNTTTVHEIRILLGRDDCNGEYRQFSHDSLRYTIAHELGHYLGLRHTSDSDSLMYTGGFDHADNIFTYRNLGYSIPKLDRGEYMFMATEDIQSRIAQANAEMTVLIKERIELKTAEDDTANGQELAANKNMINKVTQNISILEEEVACIGEPGDFLQDIASLS